MKFVVFIALFIASALCDFPLPSAKPLVCFAFISCGRQHLLEEAVGATFEHIQRYEPTLKYETVWVDQTPNNLTSQIAQKYPFSIRIVASHAMGRSWPYNMAMFELCTAPYVALLEEDRPFIRDVEKSLIRSDFIQEAVEVIESDPRISGVLFRPEPKQDSWNISFLEYQTASGVQWCFRRTPKASWASYINGPTLYSISRLRTVGPLDPKLLDGEWDYTSRVHGRGFALASVKRRAACSTCSSACSGLNWHHGATESTQTHINKVNKCTNSVVYGF